MRTHHWNVCPLQHRLREMSPLWEMVQEGIDLKTIEWTQDSHH
jgi:hypothetical protein